MFGVSPGFVICVYFISFCFSVYLFSSFNCLTWFIFTLFYLWFSFFGFYLLSFYLTFFLSFSFFIICVVLSLYLHLLSFNGFFRLLSFYLTFFFFLFYNLCHIIALSSSSFFQNPFTIRYPIFNIYCTWFVIHLSASTQSISNPLPCRLPPDIPLILMLILHLWYYFLMHLLFLIFISKCISTSIFDLIPPHTPYTFISISTLY